MSSFESRKSEALLLLEATGMRPSNYLPPATKALWRFGVEVPPPHFVAFGKIALFFGVYFACAWGLLMYLLSLFWLGGGTSRLPALAVASVGAGILFGLGMAAYYAYGRRKHHLPPWEALGQGESAA